MCAQFKKGPASLGVRARVGGTESNPTRVRSEEANVDPTSGVCERGPDKRGPPVCGARGARLTREAGQCTAGIGENERKNRLTTWEIKEMR